MSPLSKRTSHLTGEAVPPLLVPVPVAEASRPLRGRRLTWHRVDSTGSVPEDLVPMRDRGPWTVSELRAATEIHDFHGTPSVGVISEEDFWRFNEPSRIVVPTTIPASELYSIEYMPDVEADITPDVIEGALMNNVDLYDRHGRVHDTSRPPTRRLRMASNEQSLIGARAWLIPNQSTTPESNFRIVSEPYLDDKPRKAPAKRGDTDSRPQWTWIRITRDQSYFLARATGQQIDPADCFSVPIDTVYIE